MSDGVLTGKVIIVTGAGGGVGRGIALEAAREGARVVVNDPGGSVTGNGVDPTALDMARFGARSNCIAPFAFTRMVGSIPTGHIFKVGNNEIYLFSQPRAFRSAHTGEPGWTPRKIIDRVFPLFRPDLYALDRSVDVFTWDPV